MNLNDIFTEPYFEQDKDGNQIEHNDYISYAQWANENGYIIQELDTVDSDGHRQFTVVEPPKTTLEEARSRKLSELTTITSKFDNQLVNNEMIIKSSLGFSINADLRSQNNLRGLIAVGVEPVNFMTADNSVQSLRLEQLNILLSECAQNGQYLYLLKWQYREQIEQAQTVEELNTIEFNFTMKDFSKEKVVTDE